jgi:ankyrin repeat protein
VVAALHIAVAEDHVEIVQLLVSSGHMLNLQEKKNKFTPLMLCLAQQPPHFDEIFAAILKGKPDLDVQDSAGQTILHLAVRTLLELSARCIVDYGQS